MQTIRFKISRQLTVTLTALAVLTACGKDPSTGPRTTGRILRVDGQAAASGNGSTWALALASLDEALARAAKDGEVSQIWVARGRYQPRNSSGFAMASNVELYGGFSGTELQLTDRDPTAHETILDGSGCFHVIKAELTDGGALDGFTITGGQASGDQAKNGGGAFFQIASRDRPPTVRNCRFIGNRAEEFGGGLYANRGIFVVNCLFLDNEAGTGGGLFMNGLAGDPIVVANCIFLGNGRDGNLSAGGGMSVWSGGEAILVNNLFSGNVADFGAGLSIVGDATVANCTFSRNATRLANGVAGLRASSGRVAVYNSILWNNRNADGRSEAAQLRADQNGELDVRSSCVDSLSGFAGAGNISSDPLFIDADGPDGLPGTLDDDLRLTGGSPCRGTGDATLLPPDLADLDADGDRSESTPIDLAETPRIPGRTSRGAYE